MNQSPAGFSLEHYRGFVEEIAGCPVCLAICDATTVLLPYREALPPESCQALDDLFAGVPDPDTCFEVPMAVPGSADLRLVALVGCAPDGDAGERSGRICRALSRVSRCASDVWSLSLELDDMTDELTSRYEELNLIYQLDRHIGGDDDAAGMQAMRRLMEDAAAHLDVAALGVFAPDDNLDLVATSKGAPADNDGPELLGHISDGLQALVRNHEGALVLNRVDDERRDPVLRDLPVKLVIAPIGAGSTLDGVVAGLRREGARDFTTSDRKLVSALADQIASFVRSSRDELTGLLNRHGFERRLAAHLHSAAGGDGLLLHLDVHNFRVLNETCGRLAGDELLRQIGDILCHVTRDDDVVARLGADEFAVLINRCPAEAAGHLAEQLLDRLRSHSFVWGGKPQDFAVSVGAVPLSRCDADTAHILSVAESTCELAQSAGSNASHVYSEDDEQLFERRGQVQWVPRIRQALGGGRFELFAQVIQPLSSRPACKPHQEILLRLRDDEGALVPPVRFIPAAERFQLMPEIDRWVVSTTLRTLNDPGWRDAALRAVWSINLSGQSLSDERFHAFLIEELERSDFPYANLCFEVTETAAVENHRAAINLLSRLKALGVSFALDDFGSGLSSFAYLKSLPVDLLKIDGSFVRGLATDPFSRATVDAVNRVGKVMGLATVAEFVEDDAIVAVLRELGVDYGQGYGLGRPQPLTQTLRAIASETVPASGKSAQVVPLARAGAVHG